MNIANKLTALCIEQEYLDTADADIFNYEVERILSTTIVGLPFFVLAILLSNLSVAVSFFWSFYYLRERCSGYHCETLWRCLIFSLVL